MNFLKSIKGKIIVGGVLLALSWGLNINYYYTYYLEKPIFFKHYYDLTAIGDVSFDFYYLTNDDDRLDISRIEIPSISNMNYHQDIYYEYSIFHHKIKKVFVHFEKNQLEELFKKNDEIHFNEIKLFLSNGKTIKTNIGEIRLSKLEYDNFLLDNVVASGFSHGAGYVVYNAEESVTIKDIHYPFEEKLSDWFSISIDKLGNTLAEDEKSRLDYSFAYNNDNNINARNVYNFDVEIHLLKKDGTVSKTYKRIAYIPLSKFFTEAKQIKQMIKEGGE